MGKLPVGYESRGTADNWEDASVQLCASNIQFEMQILFLKESCLGLQAEASYFSPSSQYGPITHCWNAAPTPHPGPQLALNRSQKHRIEDGENTGKCHMQDNVMLKRLAAEGKFHMEEPLSSLETGPWVYYTCDK